MFLFIMLDARPRHAQYTLGPVTCIDNIVDGISPDGVVCCPLLYSMTGHAQYTLGPVTCIDNVVDSGISPDGVVFFKLMMETQSGKRKAEIGFPTSSRQQKRARVHLFRDSYPAK